MAGSGLGNRENEPPSANAAEISFSSTLQSPGTKSSFTILNLEIKFNWFLHFWTSFQAIERLLNAFSAVWLHLSFNPSSISQMDALRIAYTCIPPLHIVPKEKPTSGFYSKRELLLQKSVLTSDLSISCRVFFWKFTTTSIFNDNFIFSTKTGAYVFKN